MRTGNKDPEQESNPLGALRFEGGDFVLVLEGERNRVESLHDAAAAEGVEREGIGLSGRLDRHGFERHRDRHARIRVERVEDFRDLRLGQFHREEAVAKRIVLEDVPEALADHDPHAPVEERPGSVFAARAVSEVASRKEDRALAIGFPIEHEIGILRRFRGVEVAAFVKEVLAEALAVDRKEELLRNDLVRVDVRGVEGGRNAGVGLERFHQFSPKKVRTSAIAPVTAAAAAMAGLMRCVRLARP